MNRTDEFNKSYMTDMTRSETNSEKTKIFAVVGNPVLHSKSPDIFNAAFGLQSIDAVYTRLAATRVEEIPAGISDTGISGLNVTSPFKEEIVPFLDDIEDTAQRIGAVNTIIVNKGRLHGFNTDIPGVRDAFHSNGVKTAGKKALVLGAGGAARAAVCALLPEGVDVVIANRTFEKARAISRNLGCKAIEIEFIDDALKHTDIIISCLPVATGIVKPELLKEDMTILDANYGTLTALVRDGKRRGCTIIDGREWLLYQGLAAFRILTGTEPPIESMRHALYRQNKPVRKNIALIGFMGTGKSTIAQGISEMTGMPCIDIDTLIEQKAGVSIGNIFEIKGEQAFRQMESDEIAGIRMLSGTIISCGGGVILSRANRAMLRENSIVIWLSANVDTVLKRVGNDNSRPLLRNLHEKSDIQRMLDERMPLYAEASDMIVITDGIEPEEIIRKVYGETHKFLQS